MQENEAACRRFSLIETQADSSKSFITPCELSSHQQQKEAEEEEEEEVGETLVFGWEELLSRQ